MKSMILLTNLFNMDKSNIKNMSSEDVMCAGPELEFYYIINGNHTDIAVSEGDPVGIDVETENGYVLELFKNVYWTQCED